MKYLLKTMATVALCVSGGLAYADTCSMVPGSVTCGSGSVDSLMANGMATLNGTVIKGSAVINGLLNAEDARFQSLDVNGSTKLDQCTVSETAKIKGSLSASSTLFESILEVFSGEIHLTNSKVNRDLHIGHTDAKKQTVYLDNFSEIFGNIVFDDGKGEVILRGKSKIDGKVIGGQIVHR